MLMRNRYAGAILFPSVLQACHRGHCCLHSNWGSYRWFRGDAWPEDRPANNGNLPPFSPSSHSVNYWTDADTPQVISRYSVGYVGGAAFSILNILTQLGFSTTAVILGGQTLNGISGKLPLVVGVILVGLCSLIICFFGYSVLHQYVCLPTIARRHA